MAVNFCHDDLYTRLLSIVGILERRRKNTSQCIVLPVIRFPNENAVCIPHQKDEGGIQKEKKKNCARIRKVLNNDLVVWNVSQVSFFFLPLPPPSPLKKKKNWNNVDGTEQTSILGNSWWWGLKPCLNRRRLYADQTSVSHRHAHTQTQCCVLMGYRDCTFSASDDGDPW